MASTTNAGNQAINLRQLLLTFLIALTVAISIAGAGNALAADPGKSTVQPQPNGTTAPEATCPAGGQCFADVPTSNPFYHFVNRIYQQDLVTGYSCGGPGEPCDSESRPYYRPGANVTRQQMAKFIDNARRLPEIHFDVISGSAPIFSRNQGGTAITAISISQTAIYAQSSGDDVAAITGYSSYETGVYGSGETGVDGDGTYVGVTGSSEEGSGLRGYSSTGDGAYAFSNSGTGVLGHTEYGNGVKGLSGSGNAIYGYSFSGLAGYFDGDINVTGNCTGCLGSSRIDDPTDPANKYLYHSAVQSSSMLDLYTGHVTLDAKGTAWVEMPSWFEALNKDFDYQLTCIGGHADVYIAHEIENNRFQIAGGTPNLKVSWQVTGTRHDPYSEQHPILAQQEKPADEQGTYLHPELYGQPASKGLGYEERTTVPSSPNP